MNSPFNSYSLATDSIVKSLFLGRVRNSPLILGQQVSQLYQPQIIGKREWKICEMIVARRKLK
jgi:uncharacterized protein YqgQ